MHEISLDINVFIGLATLGVSSLALCVSYKNMQLSQQYERDKLRLSVEKLNRHLNQEADDILKLQEELLDDVISIYELAGRTRSGSAERRKAEIKSDTEKVERFIRLLEPPQRTFEDLEVHELEEKSAELQEVRVYFDSRRLKARDWRLERRNQQTIKVTKRT